MPLNSYPGVEAPWLLRQGLEAIVSCEAWLWDEGLGDREEGWQEEDEEGMLYMRWLSECTKSADYESHVW